MSITIYADVDQSKLPKRKELCIDLYPGMDNDDFKNDIFCEKDLNGNYFEMVLDIDYMIECTFANENFYAVLKCVDADLAELTRRNGGSHLIGWEFIPDFKRKVIRALNSSKTIDHARLSCQRGNVIDCGYSIDQIINRLNCIMDVCEVAYKEKVSISWY